MNNRFKIRVWDKINEKWMHDTKLICDLGVLQGFYDNEQASKRRYILMQCTGLKDKNGKLIYEGDVVKDDHGAWHYVRWVYDSWQLFPCTQNNYTIGIVDDEIEVIGNIYENRELLEVNNG